MTWHQRRGWCSPRPAAWRLSAAACCTACFQVRDLEPLRFEGNASCRNVHHAVLLWLQTGTIDLVQLSLIKHSSQHCNGPQQLLDAVNKAHTLLSAGGEDQAGSRTTLVLAWWAVGRQPATGPPGGGPARHPPWRQQPPLQEHPQHSCTSEQAVTLHGQLTWPAEFAKRNDASAAADAPLQASGGSPQHVAPAWVPVLDSGNAAMVADNGSAGDGETGRNPKRARLTEVQLPLPPLRFFLTSESEIRDVYGA